MPTKWCEKYLIVMMACIWRWSTRLKYRSINIFYLFNLHFDEHLFSKILVLLIVKVHIFWEAPQNIWNLRTLKWFLFGITRYTLVHTIESIYVVNNYQPIQPCPFYYKVHIFWEGHKILRNLHQLFDWPYIGQIIGGDFAKFCGLLKIYEN